AGPRRGGGARLRDAGVAAADPVARLLGQGARLVDELQRALAIAHLRVVDRERGEGAHPRPVVPRVRGFEGAAPYLLRLVIALPGPGHPTREDKRADHRPRVAEPLGGGD